VVVSGVPSVPALFSGAGVSVAGAVSVVGVSAGVSSAIAFKDNVKRASMEIVRKNMFSLKGVVNIESDVLV
jgi:hypothetical protein